jgi:hypothetical protein
MASSALKTAANATEDTLRVLVGIALVGGLAVFFLKGKTP